MFRFVVPARPVTARRTSSVSHRLARTTIRTATLGAATVAATALAAACRDVTSPDQDPTTAVYAPALGIRLSDFTKDTSGIYYRDVVVGTGTKAIPKSTVAVTYTGYLTDGRRFDTNVGNAPLSVVVGNGNVVRGFDRALLGINQGGRRRVIIPPALAYGDKAVGTAIPAGSVLIFEIDAAGVTAPATTTTSRAPH